MDWECRDIVVFDDNGVAVYRGPRFLRCSRQVECGKIMTHGLLSCAGQCECGNRRFMPALKVLEAERAAILSGEIPTLVWELAMIEGQIQEIHVNG